MDQASITGLIAAVKKEAAREPFSIDTAVYRAANMDAGEPILFAGNLTSRLCFFARDLGKDEVKARQPLFGAAGKLVRRGVYQALYGKSAENDESLSAVLSQLLLTNTVPYKPLGNKAYPPGVRERFRPFLERLLVCHWQGNWIMPLGSEALSWFTPYGAEVAALVNDQDRFSKTVQVSLRMQSAQGEIRTRNITLAPLPHPSPLNQKYYALFPQMLQTRMQAYMRVNGTA
jgi:uracil-DNA glycosylase